MPQWDKTKRNIFITVIILVTLLVGYAFYRYISSQGTGLSPFAPPQAPVSGGVGDFPLALETPVEPYVTPLPEPTAGLEQQIQQQILLALTDFPVVGPVINKNSNRALFYKKDGGAMFSADFTGTQEKISNITIVGMTEALWSPAKDRAGVFYIDNDTLKSFLHIGTSTVISLPRDIKSFTWSPDGKQYAYLIQLSDQQDTLFIVDASGKSSKEVFNTPILDAQIQWIAPDKISFQTAPSAIAPGYAFIYSIRAGTFRRFLGPIYGLTTLWSPDANHVLVSSATARSFTMSVYDASGNKLPPLEFITLPEKCLWLDNKEFYCGVPQQFPGGIMPDDYLRGEVSTQDRILSYNIDTQTTAQIFTGGAMDMINLAVTKAKDYLIFVNKTDGILWRLKLRQ
ncbi:MAG: hypothetical protein Q8R30_05270 [bacterium]|nr:hypothetical protein [bacterium]